MPLSNPLDLEKRLARNLTRIAAERDALQDKLSSMTADKLSSMTRYAIIMTLISGIELVAIFWLAFR